MSAGTYSCAAPCICVSRTGFSESARTRPSLSCVRVCGRPVCVVVCENVCIVKNVPMNVSMSVLCTHSECG